MDPMPGFPVTRIPMDSEADMTERPNARVFSQVVKGLTFFTMIIVLSGSQVAAAASSDADAEQAIRSVLDQQVAAWNRGDIKDFMSGYWNSPDLIYVGNTKVTRGWQTLLDRFEELSKSAGGPNRDAGASRNPDQRPQSGQCPGLGNVSSFAAGSRPEGTVHPCAAQVPGGVAHGL